MEIKKISSAEITNIETSGVFFAEYTQNLINQFVAGEILTEKGNVYSEETIRSYSYFLNIWINYEENTGMQYNFTQIFPKLVKDFTVFLQKKGKSKNSISLILSKLKAVLKFAFMEGLTFWNGSGIKTPTELTTKIYLSVDELQKLKQAEMTEGQRRVLDAFFIQCFTGMRYDTLQKFLGNPPAYINEYEGKNYIDITSDKTGEQSVIPMGETIRDILNRNSGKKLLFSEEYTNRTLKIIAAKSDVNNPVATRITKGGKMQEEIISKSQLLTTHSARRTLISLAKQSEMTDREIMAISGHSTEKQMNDYNRTTNIDKVKGVLGNKFFDTKI